MSIQSITRTESKPRYALADCRLFIECTPARAKWTARKTVLFVICVASLLWGGVTYAGTILF